MEVSLVWIVGYILVWYNRWETTSNKGDSFVKERATVLGVGIDKLTMDEAVARVREFIDKGSPRLVATANAEMVMLAQSDAKLAAILASADLVVPDGAGVVWAARYHGQAVAERVAGFDLTQRLLALAAQSGYRVYFFGGAPGVAEAAAVIAQQRYPGVRIVGIRNGFFQDSDQAAIINEIHQAAPHILLAALGIPKQEKWLHCHLSGLGVPVCIGVGGTFDVMAGVVKRAPRWMQQAGLEWLYRLLRQPQRFGRMLALPKFVWRVLSAKNH
jgi:N-acetylglucosaminyldiphosphoundecaprenol N-acetyl-beta-D-mannosaminyltransferase